MSLNDLGESISEEIGGKQLAERIACKHSEELKDAPLYDVQGFAFRICTKKSSSRRKKCSQG